MALRPNSYVFLIPITIQLQQIKEERGGLQTLKKGREPISKLKNAYKNLSE